MILKFTHNLSHNYNISYLQVFLVKNKTPVNALFWFGLKCYFDLALRLKLYLDGCLIWSNPNPYGLSYDGNQEMLDIVE